MRFLTSLLSARFKAEVRSVKAEIKARKIAADFARMSTGEIFSRIYSDRLWGRSDDPEQPFFSGTGSHDDRITRVYVDSVVRFLETLPNRPDVVDLGCGDFNIGRQIRPFCNTFIACDIVPQLIDFNTRRFADLDVDFRVLDLVTDPLPTGDIVFIRQVLQHLTNDHIQQLVAKLAASYDHLILTEHLPHGDAFVANLDKPANSDIRLHLGRGWC